MLVEAAVFEIPHTDCVDYACRIWAVVIEMVHGFAKFVQLCIQSLPVCVWVLRQRTRQEGEDEQWIAGED